MRSTIGLIGGTGLDNWGEVTARQGNETPYGKPSAEISVFEAGHTRLLFLPRHSYRHNIPPHRVNYRANLWSLKEAGANRVIVVNAVGGISENYPPGSLCLPDQLIDYTWGRAHTFSDDPGHDLKHVEFAHPYDGPLRNALIEAAAGANVELGDGGCIGVMQGPRLESAAEVRRLERDGCHMVGMTSMPEAALARELGLDHAAIGVVANWAAGVSDEAISMAAIEATLEAAMSGARKIIQAYLDGLDA